MKIFLVLFALFFHAAYALDYQKLEEYKKAYQNQAAQSPANTLQPNKKYVNYLQVIYNDPKKIDTKMLESSYHLELMECTKSGVCVFRYIAEEPIEKIIQKIEAEQKDINSVSQYSRFKVVPF